MGLPHKKNFLRDVLPKGEVSRIGHVSHSSHAKRPPIVEEEVRYERVVEEPTPIVSINEEVKMSRKGGGKWRIWTIASASMVALSLVILYSFASAELVVVPRVDEARFNNDFKAGKDVVLDSWANGLSYSVTRIENFGAKNVSADGEKMLEKKSSGKITIYNQFTTKEQKLIKNTRFETPEGLIYRIDQSVIVPGKVVSGGKTTPGSIDAVVYADEPGTKYNIGSATFRLPGFKSDLSRFNGFYAKSATPILGGFSGVAKYVSDAKQIAVRGDIRVALESQILEGAKATLKPGMFIPKGAYTVEFESQPTTQTDDGSVSIKEKAVVNIYSFREDNWDAFLAGATPFASAIGSSTVRIQNRDELTFAFKNRPTDGNKEISFNVKGNAKFVWVPDKDKLIRSIAGVKKSDLDDILGSYNEILSATASFAPFWSRKFPSDPAKISVKMNEPSSELAP